jgi:hypothetical protein
LSDSDCDELNETTTSRWLEEHPKANPRLKKSASKDSLVDMVFDSVMNFPSKFLGSVRPEETAKQDFHSKQL